MSDTTNVPDITIGPSGVIVPAESEVLAGVFADLNAAFGGNLNVSTTNLATPQGQLASSLAAIIGDKNNQFMFYVSQVDPAFSSGRIQDGIGRIYFIERNAAQPTTVQCECVGAAGTAIPTGALIPAADGNLYACTSGGTIPNTGSVSLPFACTVTGPITCPAGSFNVPYQAVPGWDSVQNAVDGVPGSNVESRSAFEARRSASVAKNATGFLPAVRGAILAVANVLDAYVTQNSSTMAATIGGVSVPPHCLYASVSGGDPNAVAKAIWTKLAPGCGTAGNTTVTVTDTTYAPPQPSYSVSFEVPTPTPILVAVSIANSASVPSNALSLIQAAIIGAFAGTDGGSRATIGATIYASRYYAPVASLGSWAQIVSIEIGTATPNQFSLLLPINQAPTITASNITLTLV